MQELFGNFRYAVRQFRLSPVDVSPQRGDDDKDSPPQMRMGCDHRRGDLLTHLLLMSHYIENLLSSS